jgi:2,3-dihydroxybenzoate decarboxylase
MPSAYLGSNVVITNSGTLFSPAVLTGAVLEMGADFLMFSVDYPNESCREAAAGFERTTLAGRCGRRRRALRRNASAWASRFTASMALS